MCYDTVERHLIPAFIGRLPKILFSLSAKNPITLLRHCQTSSLKKHTSLELHGFARCIHALHYNEENLFTSCMTAPAAQALIYLSINNMAGKDNWNTRRKRKWHTQSILCHVNAFILCLKQDDRKESSDENERNYNTCHLVETLSKALYGGISACNFVLVGVEPPTLELSMPSSAHWATEVF